MTTDVQSQDLPAITNLDRPMTVQEITAQALVIQHILDKVMVDGIHYGKVPGTDKPTLLQPGAEKICATFRLAPKHAVEDLSEPHDNLYRFRVTTSLYTIRDGLFVGAGCGEASSAEEKYQWERAVCPEHWESTDPTRRRIKFKRLGDGYEQIHQVQRNGADLANTVLKMAVKRAYISATRSATAASDLLEVDLEEEVVADLVTQDRQTEPKAAPTRKVAAPKLPYGPGKDKLITDPTVTIEVLESFTRHKREALAAGKVDTRFIASDQALCAAIDAEMAKRTKAAAPAPAAPMDDTTWTEAVTVMTEQFPAAYAAALKKNKVHSAAQVKPAQRWAFYTLVQDLAAAEA